MMSIEFHIAQSVIKRTLYDLTVLLLPTYILQSRIKDCMFIICLFFLRIFSPSSTYVLFASLVLKFTCAFIFIFSLAVPLLGTFFYSRL